MTDSPATSWERLSPRLHGVREGDRIIPVTEALGNPPSVYGERLVATVTGIRRRWDPYRSKLSAGLLRGFRGPLPRTGERWLYLGAATGTTASHVADLVGPEGVVYAVEVSVRPFARLLRLAERYPNLLPLLEDARRPEEYAPWVPPVDGVYCDIAQPDQVGIARKNAELFLKDGRPLLLVLKLASLGRDRSPEELVERALAELRPFHPISPPVALEPFQRLHRLLAVRIGRELSPFTSGRRAKSRRTGPAARAR